MREAYNEIEQLKEDGQLFTEDIYEPYIDSFKDRPTVVKALCLHIAHACNLACKYCLTTSKFIVGSPPKKSTSRL